MNNSAICLLCIKPHKIHIDFFNSISNYKLFILCDDNNCNIDNNTNTNIEFIKIEDNECFERGFKNSNFCVDKNPSAWDKVFYYFSKINPNKYDYVWILEDDVFVPNYDAFCNLDNKYVHADLLCRSNICNSSINEWQLWSSANNKYELPWYSSMVCCCRISNQLFEEIGKYVEEKRELFFIETMINTIANHKKLVVKEVEEFENIIAKAQLGNRYRHFSNGKIIWMTKSIPNLKENYIYHPVKNIELQEQYRIKQ
jgi:hypothetical protein